MKDHHINLFYSDEDGCYVADIPDFYHCSALGDTPEGALREILIAKKAWLETLAQAGKAAPQYRPVSG
jgi:predicted RNase H-like HicB family nuclease